jgi:hypothetical protein
MNLHQCLSLAGAALLLAITPSTCSAQQATPSLNGTWKWVAPANPDGRIPGITFTLKQQGETLTGTVNKSTSTEAIINGVVKGSDISFQTVVQKKAGTTTTTYSGKMSGDKIKGTIVLSREGGATSAPQAWEANRVKK